MGQENKKQDEPLFTNVTQVGVVVKDVDETIRQYEKIFGKDAFVVAEGEGTARLADGSDATVKGKLAFLQLGPVQIELIQILDGETCHVEFLKESGEGIHHIATEVRNLDEEIEKFRARGIEVLQRGVGMRNWAYMDTKPLILELIETG